MGRYLLLLVAAASLSALIYGASANETSRTTAMHRASAEDALLARGAAQSAFDVALATLAADLSARPAIDERPVDLGSSASGRHGAVTAETAIGTVHLVADGVSGRARHQIEAEVLELFRLGVAVIAHGEEVEIKIDDDAQVSGHDHRVPGAGLLAGPAPTGTGIGFVDPTVMATTTGEWDSSGSHVEGAPAVGTVGSPTDIQDLVDMVLAGGGVTSIKKYELKDATVGTPLAPVVIHATGEAQFEGAAIGYGLLIVDGKLEMKDEARWEGLVVVRAMSNQKREIKLEDDASIVGGLVLLGQEYLVESGGSDGFPDGHMDLDIFSGSGMPLDRDYHKHEWDDAYDLTYLDFFSAPDLAPSFESFRTSHLTSSLRVEFVNAINAAGTYSIGGGLAPAAGLIQNGFDAVVPFSTLSTFRLDFAALCTLRGTNPGRVRDNGTTRDGAFTVRFWDGPTLIYSVSAYEHARALRDGSPSCGDTGPTVTDTDLYGEFKLAVEDNGAIRASEEAIGRLGRTVPAVRNQTRAFPWFRRSVPVTR